LLMPVMYMCFINGKFPFRSAISALFNKLDYFHFEICCITVNIFSWYIRTGTDWKQNWILASLKHISTPIKRVVSVPGRWHQEISYIYTNKFRWKAYNEVKLYVFLLS
jgi:hypothetical protein